MNDPQVYKWRKKILFFTNLKRKLDTWIEVTSLGRVRLFLKILYMACI